MLYEVITNIIYVKVVSVAGVADLFHSSVLVVPHSETAYCEVNVILSLLFNEPVITSYSIHYTKLYDVGEIYLVF